MIILEGLDKQGKTTLACKLSLKLNWPIVKFSQPRGDPFIDYMSFLLNSPREVIVDRFYLGELVYGPIFRGKSQLSPLQASVIESLLILRGAKFIYCQTSKKRTIKNFKRDNETFVGIHQIDQIVQGYKNVLKLSELPWRHYNYQKDLDGTSIIKAVLNDLGSSWLVEGMLSARPRGNPTAKTLIVGIKYGYIPRKYNKIKVPFMIGRSAETLYKAMKLGNVKLKDVLITNVVNPHSKYHPEFKSTKLEKIVFLGKEAEKISRKLNLIEPWIKVKTIPHPSYISRFNKSIKSYSRSLKAAVYGRG